MLNGIRFSRFCAVMIMVVFCALFARRTINFYTNNFNQIKGNIENYYASPPKEALLKQLFWDYLKVTNRKCINGIIILNDGRLVHEYIPANPLLRKERANVIIELKDYLAHKNTPLLFLCAPYSISDASEFPVWTESTPIEDGMQFLSMLKDNGVETLSFREEMAHEDMDFTKAFFNGDAHWTTETALWAFGKVGAILNASYGFQLDEKTWDPQEYESITYSKVFLGGASQVIGFSGLREDITAMIPKFYTNFEVYDKIAGDNMYNDEKILASGNFVDVFTPAIKSENNSFIEYVNLNNTISSRIGEFKQYKNLAAQEHKKILVIADSSAIPFVTYLATAVENVDYLYLAPKQNQELYPTLSRDNYDLVIFLVFEGTILTGNNTIENDRIYLDQPTY